MADETKTGKIWFFPRYFLFNHLNIILEYEKLKEKYALISQASKYEV